MPGRAQLAAAWLLPLVVGAFLLLRAAWAQNEPPALSPTAEYHFLRLQYTDLPGLRRGFSRGWWRQDWPEAEFHFAQGVRRLTRIDTGEGVHLRATDARVFDHPWMYATQVGYWDLSDAELAHLRDYLLRGGFLVVDDFYGLQDWSVFRAAMERVLPGQPILDLDQSDPVMQVLYEIRERTFIPGLRHLRRGPGGTIVAQPQAEPPRWRAIYDPSGHLVVAINFNMDVGDAWEHAVMPEYPEQMTTLAYRFGINYLIYAMTH